jgi:hypothetical protein
MSTILAVLGQKGGSAKSTTAHLLCLGAILNRQPAAYVLTDPKRQLKSEGRPYGVLDGRDPARLAQIIEANHSAQNGWLVIDGGGNRPNFDKAVAGQAQLCLLPFRDSEEDVEAVALDMASIPHAFAWPCAWPTNIHAAHAAQRFIDSMSKAFPLRVITPPIPFVNSAKELMDKTLGDPSTQVRAGARRAFEIMTEQFEARRPAAFVAAATA